MTTSSPWTITTLRGTPARGGLGTINTIAILRACASDEYLTPADAKALRDAMVDRYERRLPDVTESDFAA
jgi:hypothetical protein